MHIVFLSCLGDKRFLMKRDVDKIVILGSGLSINELTEREKAYINRCKVVIAMNKFMAFYKQAGLMPTHVYFVDIHQNSLRFLQHVFDVCRTDKLTELEFILDDRLYGHLTYNGRESGPARKIGAQLIWHLRRFVLTPSFRYAKDVFSYIKNRMWPPLNSMRAPEGCRYTFIRITNWMNGGDWANNLLQPLFHFRGSLTTVLNYVSIKYPHRDVFLVGNDFNGTEYFFQKELEELEFDWTDGSTPITKESGKHFSATEYKGTTMFDQFDYVLKSMAASGNAVYVCNEKSLLHLEADVPYRAISVS